MTDALKYITKKEWEYAETGSELNLKICPLCGDSRSKFYMSKINGLWDCKICGESGNLYQLQFRLGSLDDISSIEKMISKKYKPLEIKTIESHIKNLKKDPKALEYLYDRGFEDETIEFFKLGCDEEWISIPHFQDGQLWNIKQRNYIEKAFKRVAGQPTVLFNIDNVSPDKGSVLIVESETDTMAAWQMGVKNVVGLTAGAETFKPEWIPFFNRFKKVYICLNNDRVGQEGANKIAEKLGFDKCRNIILPTNDVNDYMNEKDAEQFKLEFKKAKPFNLKNISGIHDYIEKIDEWLNTEGSLRGLQLPFIQTSEALEGFKAEDFIIISGDTGVGKTTFNLNILNHFLKNGHRCLGFFLEGKIMYYIMRMMSMCIRKEYKELNQNKDEWEELKDSFSDYPMYFYSGAQSELDFNKMKELIKHAVKLYDIEFIFIDNLQKLTKSEKDLVNMTSTIASSIKDLTVDLKIPIVLISHVRKPDKDAKRVTMHDAKSSSTIYQDADIYITIWNNSDKDKDDQDDDWIITLEKNRMGEGGKDFSFVYENKLAIWRERISEIDGLSRKDIRKSSKNGKKSNTSAVVHKNIKLEEEKQ